MRKSFILCVALAILAGPALATEWSTTLVANSTNKSGMALVVDSADRAHFLFATGGGTLNHWYQSGGTWLSDSTTLLNANGTAASANYFSAAIGADNTIHMAFRWEGRKDVLGGSLPSYLGYATRSSSGTWATELDESPGVFEASGKHPGIAVDAAGNAYVGHWDSSSGATRWWYSYRDTGWHNVQIDGPQSGEYRNNSIALGPGGKAYITACDTETGTDENYWLRLATFTNGTLDGITDIDKNGKAGRDSSCVRVDSAGKVHIAYFQYGETYGECPMYATNASGSWVLTEINPRSTDTWGNMGYGSPTLALDDSDTPYVLYTKQNGNGLRLATLGSTGWTWEEIVSSGSGGFQVMDPCLILDSHGNPMIAYRNASTNDIYFSTVPEPTTLCLLALGGVGMLVRRKRSK
jgi:hypothetical protein